MQRASRPARLSLKRRQWLTAYTFILVPLLFFLAIRIAPAIYAFHVSLHRWDPLSEVHPFVGMNNYAALLDDKTFRKALINTWIYVAVGVSVGLALSLPIALALNRITRLLGLYRMLYFLPYVSALVAVSWVWRWLYASPIGFFNEGLRKLGLPAQGFLQDPGQAVYAIVAMNVWHGLGFQIIIWLAGLQAIPNVYEEAAAVDGASPWQRFRHITFPLLNPTLVFLLVVGVISALQVFTQVRNMSSQGRGGPLDSTISLVLYAFIRGFDSLPAQLGYASAVVVVLFLMILTITILQLKILQKRYEY